MKRPTMTLTLLALTCGVALVNEASACGKCGKKGMTYTYNGSQGVYSAPAYAQAPAPAYAPQPVAYLPQPAYAAPQTMAYSAYPASAPAAPAAAQPGRFRMLRRRGA